MKRAEEKNLTSKEIESFSQILCLENLGALDVELRTGSKLIWAISESIPVAMSLDHSTTQLYCLQNAQFCPNTTGEDVFQISVLLRAILGLQGMLKQTFVTLTVLHNHLQHSLLPPSSICDENSVSEDKTKTIFEEATKLICE